jgi:hypothetical protein
MKKKPQIFKRGGQNHQNEQIEEQERKILVEKTKLKINDISGHMELVGSIE